MKPIRPRNSEETWINNETLSDAHNFIQEIHGSGDFYDHTHIFTPLFHSILPGIMHTSSDYRKSSGYSKIREKSSAYLLIVRSSLFFLTHIDILRQLMVHSQPFPAPIDIFRSVGREWKGKLGKRSKMGWQRAQWGCTGWNWRLPQISTASRGIS